MNQRQVLIASALAAVCAAAAGADKAPAHVQPKDSEKCYGAAKAGPNDCGTANHTCSAKGKADKLAQEWKWVPKGSCEKAGGRIRQPATPPPKPAPQNL